MRVFGGYSNAGISLSADGSILAAAGAEYLFSNKGKISLWTVADGKLLKTISAPTITDVALSPDGQLVAAGAEDHTAGLWDVASGENEATYTELKPRDEAPRGWFDVRLSPAGEHLPSVGSTSLESGTSDTTSC
jgi:WD40 repeat protein